MPLALTCSNFLASAFYNTFEAAGVPIINNNKSIINTGNKFITYQLLNRFGIPTPKSVLLNLDNIEASFNVVKIEIGFPCVVKPIFGTHGQGVYLCETEKSFKFYIESLKSLKVEKLLLAQKYIDFSLTRIGQDIRYALNDSKIRNLGWSPKKNFDEELPKIVEYYISILIALL